ncbi:MAG: chromosome segregation SMC family protein, partial [Aestuariivirga sp.]
MKFTRLRLTGFKSFVEPVDLHIEPGLTGVVGPNGCGKSNLLEALRWVMGESSYKSMRGSGMDDVIFSGTAQRPSRNLAEVMVTLANDGRNAPPQHNDSETLEISRHIEREAGSAYRINGREARARDVQLLFADASTGARSPALVRQGQIGEIINAKPQARRLILEEAAGITGLHTRRHEAELKLNAAAQNLTRLEDVTAQLETQLAALKRQARQAVKYKQISSEIRKLEAAHLHAQWREAAEATARDAGALDETTRVLAEHTRIASETLRRRDTLGDKLPLLREEETIRAAALQRISLERKTLDEEERRAEARSLELNQRIAQIDGDISREQDRLNDTERVLTGLVSEDEVLKAAQAQDHERRAHAAATLQAAAEALASSQEAADQANVTLLDFTARSNALVRSIEGLQARIAKLAREAQETEERRRALMAESGIAEEDAKLAAVVEAAVALAQTSEAAVIEAEVAVGFARQEESETRSSHEETRRDADRLATEVRTLMNLLKSGGGGLWPAVVDGIEVTPGYEAALGAALGDDIDAAADEAAPIHWRALPPLDMAASLPDGAETLGHFVKAPPALQRRLSHIGVVSRIFGQALQLELTPGQRLVS